MKKVQSGKPISILYHIRLHEENEFNNEPNEEVYELNDYRWYRDKLIREQLAEYSPCRAQVESYSEDKYDDESLCLDEVFQDNLNTHTPLKKNNWFILWGWLWRWWASISWYII